MKYSKKETDFLIFCIELYKNEFYLSGKETVKLFREKKIDEYVLKNFESLHTTGNQYILEDLKNFKEQ